MWRHIKKQAANSDRKGDYDKCIVLLREELGLAQDEGRTAWFDGKAKCEVLAETPGFCLIRVENVEDIDDPDFYYVAKYSKGLVSCNYEHLTATKGGAPLGYPYQRGLGEEVVPGVEQKPVSGPTSATNAAPPIKTSPTSNPQQQQRSDIVIYNGKRAVIIDRNGPRVRIQYLDQPYQGKQEDCDATNVKPEVVEHLVKSWKSINKSLTEKQRKYVFGEMVKLDYGVHHLPPSLLQEVMDVVNKDMELPRLRSHQVSNVPQQQEEKPKVDVNSPELDETDWNLLFQQTPDEKKKADEENPLPEPPPEEPVQPPEAQAGPANNMPSLGNKDAAKLVNNMRSKKESKIKLTEQIEDDEIEGFNYKKKKNKPHKSERLSEKRMNKWNQFID